MRRSFLLHHIKWVTFAFASPVPLPGTDSPDPCTPWSVFQDGQDSMPPQRGYRHTVQVHPVNFIKFNSQPWDFSRFPQGTCALSVSESYVSLGGKHHPLQSALPSTPTLHVVHSMLRPNLRALTESAVFSNTPAGLHISVHTYPQFKPHGRFRHGIRPVRSPLLRSSHLLSFPPTTDMLKFVGYPSTPCSKGNPKCSRAYTRNYVVGRPRDPEHRCSLSQSWLCSGLHRTPSQRIRWQALMLQCCKTAHKKTVPVGRMFTIKVISFEIRAQVHLPAPCYDLCGLHHPGLAPFPPLRMNPARSEALATESVGNSDGQCVQVPGTYSVHVDDMHPQGVPGSRGPLQSSIPTTT